MSTSSKAAGKRKREPDDVNGHESRSATLSSSMKSKSGADDDIVDISKVKDASIEEYDTDTDCLYREAEEPFPSFAFYNPRLPAVKKTLADMANEAGRILEKHDCPTPVVQTLRRKAKEISLVPKGKSKVIGLVGPAGKGKSSLVNSLTDIPDLAKAGDLAESVTLVATIYRRAFCRQTHRFAARLEYFDSTSVTKLLADAIEDWKAYNFELPEDITDHEEARLRNRASTALSVFRAVFCEHPRFKDDQAGRESMDYISRSNTPSEKNAEVLAEVAQKMIEESCSKDNLLQECFESNDRTLIHEWLDDRLIPDETRGGPMLWPFVKEVVIGVKGSRVLERWDIADLPGLTDCNQVRVDTTLRFIANCDYLWAMDQMSRITTDCVIENLAQRYALAFKGKLAAIGTRSADNVKKSMVAHYRKKGIETHGLEEWQTTRNAIVKKLKEHQSSNRNSPDDAKKFAQLENERQSVDDDWWAKVVHTRNTFVRIELQRKCQPYMPEGVALDVFCISNAHYEAQKYGKRKEEFTLSVGATGIPALRDHVLSLAAPDAFREFGDFVDHQYTVFIRSLELWANDRLDRGWPDLLNVIKKSQKAIPGSFEMVTDTIKERCNETVIFRLLSNQESFIKDAQTALDKNISRLKSATLRSFIRRNGNHETACMAESFNELFVSGVRRTLDDDLWYPMITFSLEQMEELCRQVITTISSIAEQLAREPTAHDFLTDALNGMLKGHIAGLRQAFEASRQQLERDLRSIILRATIDGPDNYFANAMKLAYQRCQEDSGRGVVARYIQYLRAHINLPGDQSPFYVMTKAIETDANDSFDRCIEEIRSCVDKAYNDITTECEAVAQSDTESELPLRLDISKFIQRAVPAFNKVKAQLKAISEQYPA